MSTIHKPFNVIIPQANSLVNNIELERTPGVVAVKPVEQGAGEQSSAQAFCSTEGINSRGEGDEVPSYLDSYANVVTEAKKACPGYFNVGSCDNGHHFAKELLCGKEWCPTCGKDDSSIHLRRFARWLPKLSQCRSIGYLVLTIPEQLRERYRTKKSLSLLAKRATSGDKSRKIEGLLKSLGFTQGLARWHFFGEQPGKYNPHLNIILKAGRISPEKLAAIKLGWAAILGVDKAVADYSFTRKQGKMVHILKYVTRSTFHEEAWDESLASELWNFRNMRSWGDWDAPPAWKLEGRSKFEHIVQLQKGLCPVCGHALVWGKAMPIAWLTLKKDKLDLTAGYWRIDTS